MTADPQPTPPAWAESLLRRIVAADDRDAVTGDLLEMYRDTVAPSRSRFRADAWYVRQVALFLLRASLPFGLVFGAVFAWRQIFNTFFNLTPASNVWMNDLFNKAFLAVCLLASVHAARRTRRVAGGTLVAMGVTAIGTAIGIATEIGIELLFTDAVRNNPRMIGGFRASGMESMDAFIAADLLSAVLKVPWVMLAMAAAIGTLGGAIARLLGPLQRRQLPFA